MNLGADDYLTKPADIDDLLRAIAARLARRDEHAAGRLPNFDSAQPLITTESTVKKHLEHVFEKLGVENRGAASLRVREVLGR